MDQKILILIAALFILLSQFQIQQLVFYQIIRGFNRRAVRRAILLYTIRAGRARR